MLDKSLRLRKDKEFKKVFRFSRPVNFGRLSIRSAKIAPPVSVSRFGFIISNKIDKRATRRNALKRQLRTIAADLIPTLKSGYDVIVQVRSDYDYPYDQAIVREDFVSGLKRLGLI